MNWRRGFFRLWLVYAALATIGASLQAYQDATKPSCPTPGSLPTPGEFFARQPCVQFHLPLAHYLGLAGGSAALVFAIGFVLLWAFEGFGAKAARPSKSSRLLERIKRACYRWHARLFAG